MIGIATADTSNLPILPAAIRKRLRRLGKDFLDDCTASFWRAHVHAESSLPAVDKKKRGKLGTMVIWHAKLDFFT